MARTRKYQLRDCARTALRRRGYETEVVGGPGILPGARLQTVGMPEGIEFAVRTSIDREVGLTRRPDGEWALPAVDYVVVAVPSIEDADMVDVFMFEREGIRSFFDSALARMEGTSRQSFKAPIFVALDARESLSGAKIGLRERAVWHEKVSLTSIRNAENPPRPSLSTFIARVKKEFASEFDADINKVVIDIRMTG